MPDHETHYAWAGRFSALASTPDHVLFNALTRSTRETGDLQLLAWRDSILALQNQAQQCITSFRPAGDFAAILEYQLSWDKSRRPDVVVLEDGSVVVIEFKSTGLVRTADLDQVRAYARDLKGYHEASHSKRVVPILVPMKFPGPVTKVEEVWVCPAASLSSLLIDFAKDSTAGPADWQGWVDAPCVPLPKLVQAARDIFARARLPSIRRVSEAGIPELIESLVELATEASHTSSRHLVLLAGVPGSGKTLAGLQLVHDRRLEDLEETPGKERGSASSVFLSGNGPLVQVLRYALKGSKVFVKDIWSYLGMHVGSGTVPPDHVIVFDEAQRAWDRDRVFLKRKGALGNHSEPELLLDVGGRVPGWCVLVGLFGDGQEIHSGEEGGISQWSEAVGAKSSEGWIVHGPVRFKEEFEKRHVRYLPDSRLDLTVSLRSHLAADSARWVKRVLEGSLQEARSIAQTGLPGYSLYVTRDLAIGRAYLQQRYSGDATSSRWGLLASHEAKNLSRYGVLNDFMSTNRVNPGPWFDDPPSSPQSGCRLETVVTEFQCQGLELDLPLVCWGDDLWWSGSSWQTNSKGSAGVKHPLNLRINTYRVLLTRGRDGVLIFVPPEPADRMDPTYGALVTAGATPLSPEAPQSGAVG